MERAGTIQQLEIQKKYSFEINDVSVGRAIFDFYYIDDQGNECVEDVKGYINKAAPSWRLFDIKRKLMKALYDIDVAVIADTKQKPGAG